MADRWDDSSLLLAVFDTRDEAERAADVVRRITHENDRVRMGDRNDRLRAVRAEMQEEMEQSWTAPQAGLAYPREAATGLVVLTLVGCVIGAAVLLPLGFIPVGGVALWARLLVAAGVGALMGVTVALVAGPALAANRSDDKLAAEGGTIVLVEGVRPDVVEALVAAGPVRVDRFRTSDLSRAETIASQGRSRVPGVVAEMVARSVDPTADADVQSGPETNRPTPPDGPAEQRGRSGSV